MCIRDRSREELLELKSRLEKAFEDVKGKGLKLDMSRGKPSKAQLDLSMGMMDVLKSTSDLVCEEGVDCRNYGVIDGIKEAKQLLSDMMEVPKAVSYTHLDVYKRQKLQLINLKQ